MNGIRQDDCKSRRLAPAGRIRYWPEFLRANEADSLARALYDEIEWQERSIRLFGRPVKQPRLVAFYGDPGIVYRYSGTRWAALPWTPSLAEIRDRLTKLIATCFNSVLCNLYRDGADSMAWHADNEPELGPRPRIASVSLGAPRRFVMRRRAASGSGSGGGRQERFEMSPAHGSLLVMEGDVQAHWQHAVPRTRHAVGRRINLTFRNIGARD